MPATGKMTSVDNVPAVATVLKRVRVLVVAIVSQRLKSTSAGNNVANYWKVPVVAIVLQRVRVPAVAMVSHLLQSTSAFDSVTNYSKVPAVAIALPSSDILFIQTSTLCFVRDGYKVYNGWCCGPHLCQYRLGRKSVMFLWDSVYGVTYTCKHYKYYNNAKVYSTIFMNK